MAEKLQVDREAGSKQSGTHSTWLMRFELNLLGGSVFPVLTLCSNAGQGGLSFGTKARVDTLSEMPF